MITISSDSMKEQMSRAERARRIAELRAADRLALERTARRNFELAVRLSELHVERAVRLLRSAR